MIAKVAKAIPGVGIMGTVSVMIVKPEWFIFSSGPSHTKLYKDHDFKTGDETSNDYKGKFGEIHKDELVGVVGKTEGGEGNKAWWEWSFKRLKVARPKKGKFKYSGEFSSDNAVTEAYSKDNKNGNSKALNQICKAAYQLDKSKITDEGEREGEYKAEDVWKWCSTRETDMIKPFKLGWEYMPEAHALSKDSDYDSKKDNDYGNNTFGHKYRNYLIGVTNKTEGDDETSNKDWWEWSYRRLHISNITTGKFKHEGKNGDAITKAYGGDNDTTALNQVCKAAYKEQSSNVDDNEDSDKFKKSYIWKYCSPLGKEPTKINQSKYSGKIGSEDTNFISTWDESNMRFWFIRNEEIMGSGKYFEKINVSSDTLSARLKNKYKFLKELCEETYNTKKPTGGEDPSVSLTVDEAKKYCVFEISSAN